MLDKFIEDMLNLKKTDEELSSHIDTIYQLFGNADSDFINAIYSLYTKNIKMIASLYGLQEDAVSWFIYDNDWGGRNLKCTAEGSKEVKIDSLETFYKFEKGLL